MDPMGSRDQQDPLVPKVSREIKEQLDPLAQQDLGVLRGIKE
jgi:hypothetical protein